MMHLEISVLSVLCLISQQYNPPILNSTDPILPKSGVRQQGSWGPFAELHPRPRQASCVAPQPPALQSCKRGSGESRLPQTIQDSIASPQPAPLHALPQLVLCREGEPSRATLAVGSQDEWGGWGSRGRRQGL